MWILKLLHFYRTYCNINIHLAYNQQSTCPRMEGSKIQKFFRERKRTIGTGWQLYFYICMSHLPRTEFKGEVYSQQVSSNYSVKAIVLALCEKGEMWLKLTNFQHFDTPSHIHIIFYKSKTWPTLFFGFPKFKIRPWCLVNIL